MPYLKPEDRDFTTRVTLERLGRQCKNKGELNWAICILVLGFLDNKKTNYQTLSDAVGAVYDASHELRRRILDPYEDIKIEENGDIL